MKKNIYKKLSVKPKAGKKPTGKEKKVEHNYILQVPNDKDGQKFYKLFKKYLDKRYVLKRRGNHHDRVGLFKEIGKQPTSLMDVPIKHAESWRFYLEVKHTKSILGFKFKDTATKGVLSWRLFEAIDRIQNVGLRDLIFQWTEPRLFSCHT